MYASFGFYCQRYTLSYVQTEVLDMVWFKSFVALIMYMELGQLPLGCFNALTMDMYIWNAVIVTCIFMALVMHMTMVRFLWPCLWTCMTMVNTLVFSLYILTPHSDKRFCDCDLVIMIRSELSENLISCPQYILTLIIMYSRSIKYWSIGINQLTQSCSIHMYKCHYTIRQSMI